MQKGPFTAPPVISFLSWPLFFLSPPSLFCCIPPLLSSSEQILLTFPYGPPGAPPPRRSLGEEETVMKRTGKGCTCASIFFNRKHTTAHGNQNVRGSLPSPPRHRSVRPKHDASPRPLPTRASLRLSPPVPRPHLSQARRGTPGPGPSPSSASSPGRQGPRGGSQPTYSPEHPGSAGQPLPANSEEKRSRFPRCPLLSPAPRRLPSLPHQRSWKYVARGRRERGRGERGF